MVRCPDRKGLIARITGLVAWLEGNVVTADQYTTAPEGGVFYMRQEMDEVRRDRTPTGSSLVLVKARKLRDAQA